MRENNSDELESKKTVKDLIKPVLFVPGKMPILSVLPRMQKGLVHTAIIQDAFGITKGMLTQEDILEEIVGDIQDEYDEEQDDDDSSREEEESTRSILWLCQEGLMSQARRRFDSLQQAANPTELHRQIFQVGHDGNYALHDL